MRLPVTAILGLCLFLTGVASAAVAPYRGIVAIDGLGMSNGLYAIVLTLGSVGAAFGSVTLGYLSDKVSDRRWLVIGCAAMGAIAYGMIYFLPTQATYITAVCVILPFGAALFSQTFSYSRTYYNQQRPDRAEFMMSALRSLFSLSWVVTPPIVGWLAASYSVFHVFLVAAIGQFLCMIVFGVLLSGPDARVRATRPKPSVTGDPARMPRSRAVGIAGVTLLRIAILVNLTAFPLVILNDIGGSLTDLGIASSLAAALEVPLMLMWGWAATRWPRELIMIINGVLFAAFLFLVPMARSMQDVLLLQMLNALATAALVSIPISYLQDAIRGRVGLSTSLIDVITVLAGFVSAGLFGWLASPGSYDKILVAGAAISLGGAALMAASWGIGVRNRT